MRGLIFGILRDLIGNKDVQRMRCSEARKIVNEFCLRVDLLTFGRRDDQAIEHLTNTALIQAGLEGFV